METGSLRIKVCGMRDPRNLELICGLAPDLVGFIFYPHSKRYVGRNPDPALFQIPGQGITKVGVFVDQELSEVKRIAAACGLDMIQLHGSETVDYCMNISGEGLEIIKTLDPRADPSEMAQYEGVANFYLFDSAGGGKGGTGQKFDWGLLAQLDVAVPYFLSGGIGPGDAESLKKSRFPGMVGVDINSRFEVSPGEKDIRKVKDFIGEIRK
jgi:phosphoribosylanthranilate isomerase